MTRIDEKVWVGDSDDGHLKDNPEFSAVLNVAHDLEGVLSWPEVEYMQVGLVDGPGNEVITYCAAIVALVALTQKHDKILMYDHNGGRALAVALMYLTVLEGKIVKRVGNPTLFPHRRRGWEEHIFDLRTKHTGKLPDSNAAHVAAFYKIPYDILEVLL